MDTPPAEATAAQEPLAYRATRGGLWVALGSYFTTGFGFLANLVLTRLLMPEHYGIFSLGIFFFSLVNLQPKIGIGYAFGQRQETTGELIGTHLALDIAASTVTWLLVMLTAPVLLAFGYSGDVIAVMVALTLIGVIGSFGNTAFLLLEKALCFRQTSLLGSLVFALSYLPAFWLALNNGGYWSLVVQNAAATVPMILGVWWLARRHLPAIWQLRWRFDRAVAQGLLRFGIVVGLSGVFAMIAMSFDNFLVGTFVGVAVLGFYDRAYRLAEWPNKLVTSVVTRTAFYTYARLQDDSVRLQKTVTMLTWLIAMITIPLALIIFVAAPDLVALLYGERWLPSAVFLRLLVIYSLIRPLLDNAGSLLVSTGHPQKGSIGAMLHALFLVIVATPLTFAYGALGTCVAVGIAFVIALAVNWYFMHQILPLSLRDTFAAPALAAILSMAAYALLVQSVNISVLPLPVQVAVEAGFVVFVFFVALFAIQPQQTVERSRYVWQLLRGS